MELTAQRIETDGKRRRIPYVFILVCAIVSFIIAGIQSSYMFPFVYEAIVVIPVLIGIILLFCYLVVIIKSRIKSKKRMENTRNASEGDGKKNILKSNKMQIAAFIYIASQLVVLGISIVCTLNYEKRVHDRFDSIVEQVRDEAQNNGNALISRLNNKEFSSVAPSTIVPIICYEINYTYRPSDYYYLFNYKYLPRNPDDITVVVLRCSISTRSRSFGSEGQYEEALRKNGVWWYVDEDGNQIERVPEDLLSRDSWNDYRYTIEKTLWINADTEEIYSDEYLGRFGSYRQIMDAD